ncbi:MAG: class C sortase [Lachnospiraceae bacterium]|nr:class C sortase [Lachnospiraceae bacterium]
MKGKKTTILLVIMFIVGLSLLLYPTVSNYWNSLHQSRVIRDYSDSASSLNKEKYEKVKEEAVYYNDVLSGVIVTDDAKSYDEVLDPFGTGIMGYIEIPAIGCELPIAHGTEDDTLKESIGHLEWTSLPVGGKSTHSVLSGHRGLPTAELLTNMDKLKLGDRFTLHILGEELEYMIDQIIVVEPEDTSALGIIKDMDLVTLVTCTPYGINSHRLLVRGTRIDKEVREVSAISLGGEVKEVSPIYLTAGAVLIVLVAAVICMASYNSEKSRKKREREEKRFKRKEHYRRMQEKNGDRNEKR